MWFASLNIALMFNSHLLRKDAINRLIIKQIFIFYKSSRLHIRETRIF